jgi:hypothetical protein
MTAAAPARVRWLAGADRIAHASHPRQPRTMCGELVVPQPLAWPPLRRCLACASLAGEGIGL